MRKVNDDLSVYNGEEAIEAMRAMLGNRLADTFDRFEKDLRNQFGDVQIITEAYIDDNDKSKNIAMFINHNGRISFARMSETIDGQLLLKNEI